jgi:hypothetical protein
MLLNLATKDSEEETAVPLRKLFGVKMDFARKTQP